MSSPDLSIVLACAPDSCADAALAKLRESCRAIMAEVIVVAAGAVPTPVEPAALFPGTRVEILPAGSLTPVLWGAGLRLARGRWVAFTTDQLRVSPSWAATLVSALASGFVGVGGPIELAQYSDTATAAAYFIRFSAFAPDLWPSARPARDIPGDNAAYRRESLLRHPDLLESGFWEVEFHRRFEREGGVLRMEPGASAELVGPVAFGPMLRQRYRHARVFGNSRVRRHGEGRVKLLLSAPLVPLVLLARLAARALPPVRTRRMFLEALPRLALLSTAWAAGEAAGAVRAWGREAGS